ncbi:MAG TPA: cysteine desulfurase family protein [Candidatus Acidoferrales bacterium]|nr:cysteine desulfurase family protein [Candidatus Acidoferrales bacterium]
MLRIYFDNNATTPLLPEVFEAMRPYFIESFGNASSIHRQGQRARAAVEQAREHVAELIGSRPAEVVFTSGGTEGDNLAIFGVVSPGQHIITTAIEHHAVLNACKKLEAEGVELTIITVDGQGRVNPDDVKSALRPNTQLISVMMANNETGVLQPVREIGRIAAEADVFFHTDAVQAAAKVPIDVNEINCDLLTIAGHKMHAPQGTGALYVRRGTLLKPLLYGGRHERSRRAGTENLAGIVGLGKAAELAQKWFAENGPAQMAALRDRLERGVLAQIERVRVNSGSAPRTPNTSNILFDCIEGEAFVIAMDLKGISVSTGAACSSGAIEPSHVLVAMGLNPDEARGSIRFSLGKQNTAEEVDIMLELLPEVLSKLRELSPAWKKHVAVTN